MVLRLDFWIGAFYTAKGTSATHVATSVGGRQMSRPDVELSRLTSEGQCTFPRRIMDYLGRVDEFRVSSYVTLHDLPMEDNACQYDCS